MSAERPSSTSTAEADAAGAEAQSWKVSMSAPDIDDSDIAAVTGVLRSGRLALGPQARGFERLVAEHVGVRHAVAVSSGTAALHLLVHALQIGAGDEVLVPSFTFAATVNVLLHVGAVPAFVDIEPETYNIDPEDLERKVTERTKAVIAVDIFGHPAAWDEILAFARGRGLPVIDDACEALGASYRGRKVGSLATAASFAFYPNKQITTGEGGMIVTDDEHIAGFARSWSNQGRSSSGAWLDHEAPGYNYRLDELSAALGVSQFRRLEDFMARRRAVAGMYAARLAGLDWLRPPRIKPEVDPSWFVYVVTLEEGVPSAEIVEALAQQGIPSRVYFQPIHQMPYMRGRARIGPGGLPVTESISGRTLALPFHNRLGEDEVSLVVEALRAAR